MARATVQKKFIPELISGTVAPGLFSGTPKKFAVTFPTLGTAAYAINITGGDARSWTIESQVATGFVINSNADTALTQNVNWEVQVN